MVGKRIDDGERLRYDLAGFLASEFSCQPAPFLHFFDGVSKIGRRVNQEIFGDADLFIVGIDHAQVRALERAQTEPHEIDRRAAELMPISEGHQRFLHDLV